MFFGWQKALRGVAPVIVHDEQHGCAKMEFVGRLIRVKPEHQALTLEELALLYPAPHIQPSEE